MKVRIVCYEDVDAWILGKFARKMHENLLEMGVDSSIAKVPDPTADINHHIIYYDYDGRRNSIDTVMVTHIDNMDKKLLLERQLKVADLGICMSGETMALLAGSGISEQKLAFVLPAHDGAMKIRKILIGITCRVQEDGRKREYFLYKISKTIDPTIFKFVIMGDGWDQQVATLKNDGFEVEYHTRFDYEKYLQIIPSLDYYLYMGLDEGQMGFIDALSSGVKTIVTSQGYHLDAPGGMTHPFKTLDELLGILKAIELEKKKLIDSVKTWNWRDYTKKHVEIWKYLILKNKGEDFSGVISKSEYTDGVISIGSVEALGKLNSTLSVSNYRAELILNFFYHQYFKSKKLGLSAGSRNFFRISLSFLWRFLKSFKLFRSK
jgi:hypothetical protein